MTPLTGNINKKENNMENNVESNILIELKITELEERVEFGLCGGTGGVDSPSYGGNGGPQCSIHNCNMD